MATNLKFLTLQRRTGRNLPSLEVSLVYYQNKQYVSHSLSLRCLPGNASTSPALHHKRKLRKERRER
ncbi:hypothetical protein VTK73DRAFT_6513 [Phialemonium thermophilum]|uniref:Uncharacterized protein n=1 Tax=Phialemonium thermophilum TaxID=223376 RepID=A0ABR3WJ54_9PEZI